MYNPKHVYSWFFMSYNFNPSKPKQSKAMLAAEASSQTLEWQFFAIASQGILTGVSYADPLCCSKG